MDFSKLSYGAINEKADLIGTNADEMGRILEEIKVLFAKVGDDSTWAGTAASQAKQTFDTLSAKFVDFAAAVKSESGYLKSVVANYQAVDSMASSNQG